MSHTQVQFARGNTAAVAPYTGPQGETVLDTDDWSLVLQDGATAGGIARLRPGPNWQFPAGAAAYTATVADGGKVLSSYNATGAGLTVTLPAIATLTDGWSIAFATDNGKTLTVDTAGSGQNILLPGIGAVGSVTLAAVNYEYLKLEYDGGGSDFRVTAATPATLAGLGVSGGGSNYAYAQPASGATLTAAAWLGAFVADPSAALAALTVVMPPGAIDGQLFEISTSQTISALTVSPASGQTVNGGTLMLTANGGCGWRFRGANNTWYRRF